MQVYRVQKTKTIARAVSMWKRRLLSHKHLQVVRNLRANIGSDLELEGHQRMMAAFNAVPKRLGRSLEAHYEKLRRAKLIVQSFKKDMWLAQMYENRPQPTPLSFKDLETLLEAYPQLTKTGDNKEVPIELIQVLRAY